MRVTRARGFTRVLTAETARVRAALQSKKSWETTNVRIKDMQATAAMLLLVMSGNMQPALAQTDYSRQHPFFPNPLKLYTPTVFAAPRLGNTPRLGQLLRDGKIYLSLSDAVLLALENNFDIAIARINLDIADTDILRAKAGSFLRGVPTGTVADTLGGSGMTVTGGGGPGGTSGGAGGGGAT